MMSEQPPTVTGASSLGLDPATLRAAYAGDTAAMVAQRLWVTVALFLALVGVTVIVEPLNHPERRETVWLFYAAEALGSALVLWAIRRGRLRPHAVVFGVALGAWFSVCFTGYSAASASGVERVATAQVCLLTSLLVLLPWGWRAQLVVSLVALGGLVPLAPQEGLTETYSYAILATVAGALTSIAGAHYTDRYRFAAFAHIREREQAEEALIAAKSRAEEQAEIAAALRHVGEALAVNLGRPDMFEGVTELAVAVLRCDWAVMFMWDERRETLKLQAAHGARAEVLEEIAQLAAIPDRRSVVHTLRPGKIVEIAELRDRGLVRPDLLRRWEVAAGLCAPIPGRLDVVGFLCAGYRTEHEPFTVRQRHLALGIAEATAVAFENARLIADLQRANRLKSEFVSTISHELRTPLNVILGFTEMARDPELRGDVDRLLDRVDAAARELLDLVESTLSVGKLEAGRDDVHLETVRLPEFWRKLRDGFTAIAQSPAVTLDWCADVPDVELTTDPRKLAIVTRNLVGNALKFTERGWVRAAIRAEQGAVVIEVADTGIGIRPEDQEAVFEMFRQVDGSEARRFGGTGLGLHIVRRFVHRLGGTVSLASEPGKGSVFTVRLERA
jgi:signal transduction histidine kinase